jgi:hypothetical protein
MANDVGVAGMSFKRICGDAFLDLCTPRIRRFHQYWLEMRGARLMPARADIDPSAIKALLPGIILIDVRYQPLALTYRLVGTDEVLARGADPTGQDVLGNVYADDPGEMLRTYQLVIETRDVVYQEEPGVTHSPRLSERGMLVTPLSSDGTTVDKIFAFVDYSHD